MSKAVIKAPKGVKVIFTGYEQDRSAQGIHLTDPTGEEYQSALETAARDRFDTIYIHLPNVVRLASYKRKAA